MRRRRTRSEPRAVGGAIDGVLARLGLRRVVEQHTVFSQWGERVGPEIARAARPHRVDGDTLIVLVVNSAWMNELSLRSRELLGKLNAGRRASRLARIVFRIDPDSGG